MIYIRKPNGSILDRLTEPSNGCVRKVKLMEEDSVTLKFSLSLCKSIPVGSYIDMSSYNLWRFYTLEPYSPTYNTNTGGYDYEVVFHNYYRKWKNKIFKYLPKYSANESSWSLTGNVSTFGQVIEENLETLGYTYNGLRFVVEVDSKVDLKPITLTFSSTSILDALTAIAEASNDGEGCDWWVDEQTIHFGSIEAHKGSNVTTLSLGDSVESLSVDNGQDSYASRIYGYGSDRNITKRYRKELRLYPNNRYSQYVFRDGFRKITYDMFAINEEDYNEEIVSNSLSSISKQVIAETSAFKLSYESDYQKISDGVSRATTYRVTIKNNWSSSNFGNVVVNTSSVNSVFTCSGYISVYSYRNGVYDEIGRIGITHKTADNTKGSSYVTCPFELNNDGVFSSVFPVCNGVYYKLHVDVASKDTKFTTMNVHCGTLQFIDLIVEKLIDLECYKTDGTYIETIEAIINPYGKALKDDDSTWISGVLPENTSYFIPIGIKKSKANLEWFTNKNKPESSVNAVVSNRLLLPECRYFVSYGKFLSINSSSNTKYTIADLISEKKCISNGYTEFMYSGVSCYKDASGGLFYPVYNGKGYVDREQNLSVDELVEEVVVSDNIYPTFEIKVLEAEMVESTEEKVDGELTGNTLYVWHIRSNIKDFSNKYRIDDSKEFSVTFSSGKLNGMTFEVKYLSEKTRKDVDGYCWFEIFRNEDYAVVLPNDILYPDKDDTLNLFNFDTSYLNDSLELGAEETLLLEILNLSLDRKHENKTYTLSLMSDWVYNNGDVRSLEMGQLCKVTGYMDTPNRIVSIETKLDYPYDTPVVTIGKTSSYSRLGDLQKQIDSLGKTGSYYEASSGARNNTNYLAKYRDDSTNFKIGVASLDSKGNITSGGNVSVDGDISSNGSVNANGEITTDNNLKVNKNANVVGSLEFGDKTDTQQNFSEGLRGTKIWLSTDGWHLQVDNLSVMKKMYAKSVQVDEVTHIGGQILLTDADCVVDHVVDEDGYYKCFFRSKDGEGRKVYNLWKKGDLAYCQMFNIDEGVTKDFTNRYYWMQVYRVGTTIPENDSEEPYHYIWLNKAIMDKNNTLAVPSQFTTIPQAGDNIIQLGHIKFGSESDDEAKARQGATFISGGSAGQYIAIFDGIKSFGMPDPKIYLSPSSVSIIADYIKLKSTAQLELSSNQLMCTNADGEKTAWLDSLGNFVTSGVQSQLLQNIDTKEKFLDKFIVASSNTIPVKENAWDSEEDRKKWKDDEDYYIAKGKLTDGQDIILESEFISPLSDTDYLALGSYGSVGLYSSLDMRTASGLIVLKYVPKGNMVVSLPYLDLFDYELDVRRHEGGNLVDYYNNVPQYSICRTPTRMNTDNLHFITLDEIKSLVGRRVTILNDTEKDVFFKLSDTQDGINSVHLGWHCGVVLEFSDENCGTGTIYDFPQNLYSNMVEKEVPLTCYHFKVVEEIYDESWWQITKYNFGTDFAI